MNDALQTHLQQYYRPQSKDLWHWDDVMRYNNKPSRQHISQQQQKNTFYIFHK